MLRTRIISFVCILLCITTGARAEDYKWKVKDGKMALFSKPYKGKWGQVTDYIYDVNFSASYCSDKNKKPYFFDRHYSLIQVKNSQGIGIINWVGDVVIPLEYIEKFTTYSASMVETFVQSKDAHGKQRLFHINTSYPWKVTPLEGSYDAIEKKNKSEFVLKANGKMGQVRWDKDKKQFERQLPCIYTTLKLDSIMTFDLCEANPKWTRTANSRNWMLLEDNGKYGIWDGSRFVVKAGYDLESFKAPAWTGFKGAKGHYLMEVKFLNRNNNLDWYYMLQADGERCIFNKEYREVFTHKIPTDKPVPFDFVLTGLGDILYVSRDNEKWFYRSLEDRNQVNCRGDLALVRPFVLMPNKKHTYWVMNNEKKLQGLYNSETDRMILPAEYKAIEMPNKLKEIFTVTDSMGNKHKAFITHDGAEVVVYDKIDEVMKRSKLVRKHGKYDIMQYKGGYGLYIPEKKSITSFNYSSIQPLGEVYPNVAPEYQNFLLIKRNNKVGLVGNTYMINCMFDEIEVGDTMLTLTYKEWYNIHPNKNKKAFFIAPQRMKEYKQYFRINSAGKEVIDNNLFATVMKWGDDDDLQEEVKSLVIHLRNNDLINGYKLGVASWHVERRNFGKALGIYESLRNTPSINTESLDNIIAMVKQLKTEKEEQERWEAQQIMLERERERKLAEEQRQMEEYERQRRYAEQQRRAEEARQIRQQAVIDMLNVAGNLVQEIGGAVQNYYGHKNQSTQKAPTRNYNAQYNQQVGNINANELRDAKKYYNEWAQRAEREMKEYIEADAKLKVPGISQMTRTFEQQRRSRARSYLKDSCLKMMRTYRNRAAQLGGNIPISQTELKVEALLN